MAETDIFLKLPETVREVYRVLLRDVMALKRKSDSYLGLGSTGD
jgi:hypothetical protein